MSIEGKAAEQGHARAARRHFLLSLPALLIVRCSGRCRLLLIVVYSFLKAAPYGGVQWLFSTAAYVGFLFKRDILNDTLIFQSDYLWIYFRSILFAIFTTLFCLLVGFPTAYFMATRSPHQRNWWVLLVTIPFWSNLLVRTLAIMFIIRDEGLVNSILLKLHVIDKPITMLFTDFAIVIGLLYSFLPFMILPLYSNLEKLDFRLVEAGFDLYATRSQVLWRVVIPLAKPGIVAGLAAGVHSCIGCVCYAADPGWRKHLMIGSLIAQQFGSGRNWPLGCAQALILMAAVLVALYAYVRNSSGKVLHG